MTSATTMAPVPLSLVFWCLFCVSSAPCLPSAHIHLQQLQQLQRAVLTAARYLCHVYSPDWQSAFPDSTSHSCSSIPSISSYAAVTFVFLAGEESSCISLDRICVHAFVLWFSVHGAFYLENLITYIPGNLAGETSAIFFFCWSSMFYRLCTPFFLRQLLLLQLSEFSVSL